MRKLTITAIILASIAILGEAFIFATSKDTSDDIQRKAIKDGYNVYAPVLPDTVFFAGERVPMNTYYVRESLDRELMVNMYWQSNMMLLIKRANRYFPIIEPILKKNGIPEDFKYLCVIESGLQNVTSPAKAQGYWQFIKATGERYGLFVNDEIDMRNDIKSSTEAACRFLNDLYRHFGSWTCAAAAYNCGENGLTRRMQLESINNYFDVRLNKETSRYVYRIIAIKLIMQHLPDYGYHVRQCDLYPPIPTRTATLSGKNVNLYDFAKENNCSYKMLRELNPWILTDQLKNKENRTYTVRLPISNGTDINTINQGKKKSTLITRL